MKDTISNQGFLYGHMKEPSPLNVGASVSIGTYVGIEGTTGHSTGNHVHVESQDMTGKDHWTFGLGIEDLLNPTLYMSFPNEAGTRLYYTGIPVPPTPPTPYPVIRKNNKNMWKWQKRKNFKIIY